MNRAGNRRPKLSGRARAALALQLFVKRYGRPAQADGRDPNDRRHDRDVERRIRNLSPEALDGLLRDGEDR